MPIPKPRSGESESDFLDRCIPFLIDEGKDPEQAQAICFRQLDKISAFATNEAHKKMLWKQMDQRRFGFLAYGQRRFKRALDRQIKPVLDALKEGTDKARAAIQAVDSNPIRDAFIEVYGTVGTAFGMSIFRGLKSHAGDYQVKADVQEMLQEFIKEWIRFNGLTRIQGITENTRRHLRQAIDKGIEEGMGIEELARMISNDRRIAGLMRARVIARTEIISASNAGSLEGARRTNLNLNKEWISTRDGRTRRISEDRFDHLHADGQVVGLEENFTIQGRRGPEQLMFPGDPSGSPGNVVQCRCTVGYIPK